jgi:hypothetical protein
MRKCVDREGKFQEMWSFRAKDLEERTDLVPRQRKERVQHDADVLFKVNNLSPPVDGDRMFLRNFRMILLFYSVEENVRLSIEQGASRKSEHL